MNHAAQKTSATRHPLWPEGSTQHSDLVMDYSESGPPQAVYEVHLPSDVPGPTPAMVIAPGGGYQDLCASEAEQTVELFLAHGLAAIVCYYRVHPHQHPKPYADLARTMRLTRRHAAQWNIDPQRIGLFGYSAGGHNAATVATQPELHLDPEDDLAGDIDARPNKLVLAYPVVSFTHQPHPGSRKKLIGEFAEDQQVARLSAELHVNRHTPPTFLFHTVDDPVVPVSGVLRFAQACQDMDVPYELHCFAHGPHGVHLGREDPALAAWPQLMLNWLGDWIDTD